MNPFAKNTPKTTRGEGLREEVHDGLLTPQFGTLRRGSFSFEEVHMTFFQKQQ
jgi:hypothetical protein